ncbi:acetylserotonin O-methyltransferase [Streptomyces deccanensis]|uniref:acetylserotonin O-methyltransferase n=1 Tax=Streptomyces deccanensis TaxID=424188 RepID=UPI001EFBD956|nr:acetylserotonin O-methyltransferase [Streptomyces deccanensis]ULR51527.1 acetylserotonin O-methyltransferase [Streptomyces deccanensis]
MPAQTSDVPPHLQVLNLATASWMSAAVSAAADLGVADHLGSGPRTVTELAAAIGAHEPTLYRLLRACADFDLFREHEGRVFESTELGDALRTDSPNSMRNFARWVSTPADRWTWSGLAETVRTGTPAFAKIHGTEIWDHFNAHDETGTVFDDAMTELSRQVIAEVVTTYDFTPFATIADIGGGHGTLLTEILKAAPGTRGVLFDRPEVIEGAGEVFDASGVRDRVELVSGDFFEAVPSGADALVLSNIIHDWDDEQSVRILTHCERALAPGGRVLLVEATLPDGTEPAPLVKLVDLDMLVLSGGSQRTAAEFDGLFQRSGLKLARVVSGGLCSVVEAVRA